MNIEVNKEDNMGIIKDFINYLIGDCETCKYEKDCPYIEERKGSCFEIGGI